MYDRNWVGERGRGGEKGGRRGAAQ